MNERSVVIIGLPASGKTTYLAALWHLMTSGEATTMLEFVDLREGTWKHLNSIAARWRRAVVQERTAMAGDRIVSMNLRDRNGEVLRVSLPDLPGEAYRRMWEERYCTAELAKIVRCGGLLLFVHADDIRTPMWTVEEMALAKQLGVEGAGGPVEPWAPEISPTQVQLVDLLQMLRVAPLDAGARRLAVMLTAWDRARDDGLGPEEYMGARLPLLHQYLGSGADGWCWRVYGVSAQGGVYDATEEEVGSGEEARRLRELDRPAARIQLVGAGPDTSDLTEPLAWVMA